MSKIISRSSNGTGNMLKIEDKESKKGYTWFFMTEAVVAFVDKVGIKPEDDIEFTSEEVKGEETIVKINKFPNKQEESQFKCEKCGTSLKDNKYKTCYTCSMKIREEEANSPEGKTKQASIEKQCCLKSACEAVKSIKDITDVSLLISYIEVIYERLLKKLYE